MTWYQSIRALQPPYDNKLDSAGRHMVQFNIIAVKAKSGTFVFELIKLLMDANVGVFGVTVFASSSVTPNGSGPFLSVIPTSGMSPQFTHNNVFGYERPTALISARSGAVPGVQFSPFELSLDLAMRAHDALVTIRNREVGLP